MQFESSFCDVQIKIDSVSEVPKYFPVDSISAFSLAVRTPNSGEMDFFSIKALFKVQKYAKN